MSKFGNVIAPQKVIEQNGADILRLWVVSWIKDDFIGHEIIKSSQIITVVSEIPCAICLAHLMAMMGIMRQLSPMPELERWVLHRLSMLDGQVREKTERYDFHGIFTALMISVIAICQPSISISERQPVLCYADSLQRRACWTVDSTLRSLISWIAPILCFTADEAWLAIHRMKVINPSARLCRHRPKLAGQAGRKMEPYPPCAFSCQDSLRLHEMTV